jgi:hypothetical protein
MQALVGLVGAAEDHLVLVYYLEGQETRLLHLLHKAIRAEAAGRRFQITHPVAEVARLLLEILEIA